MEMTIFVRRLFELLGIETRAEGLEPKEALDLVRDKLASVREVLADDAVDEAVAAKKIARAEVEWARKLAVNDLPCFKSFARHRKPICERVSEAVAGRLNIVERRRPAAIGDLQAQINRQVGLSETVFLRHTPVKQIIGGISNG